MNETTSLTKESLKSTEMTEIQAKILSLVLLERLRQNKMYGSSPRNLKPSFLLVILNEEIGEVARTIIDGDSSGYFQELIQICAVSLMCLEEYFAGHSLVALEDVCKSIEYQQKTNLDKLHLK